ncbi:MAG: hypothetical protein ACRYG7_46745 [Janthinobacterium lividum]
MRPDVGFDRHYRVHHSHDKFVQGAAHLNGMESFGRVAKSRLHQFLLVPRKVASASELNQHLGELAYRRIMQSDGQAWLHDAPSDHQFALAELPDNG